jgi:acetyl esterase/lipase
MKTESCKANNNNMKCLAKLPLNWANTPSGTDVEGMRKWVDETFGSGLLDEDRAKCEIRRRQPKAIIDKKVVSIIPSDGSNIGFELWIYQSAKRESITRARPAILMFHGGGFIHGSPLGDERK